MFHTLLIKDWRLARLPRMAMGILGLLCYALPLTAWACSSFHDEHLDRVLQAGASGGIYMAAVLAAAFGGAAFAGERVDRTGDFIGLLPVTRLQSILSKWAVAVGVLMISTAFHAFIWLSVEHVMADGIDLPLLAVGQYGQMIAMWFGAIVCLYGVAWLLGTWLESSAISACFAIGLTTAILLWVNLAGEHHDYLGLHWAMQDAVLTFALGAAGLVAGTTYYLKRVAP